MKGLKRLEVENKLTQQIQEFDEDRVPGIKLKFLETKSYSKDCGDWIEYNVLYEIVKYSDTPEYLEHIFKSLGKIISSYSYPGIDTIGIQEIDCGGAEYYYVLIYILSDGKDKESKDLEYSTECD